MLRKKKYLGSQQGFPNDQIKVGVPLKSYVKKKLGVVSLSLLPKTTKR